MPKIPIPGESRDRTASHLLHRLNSDDAGSAWAEFLDQYAPLIMKVTGEFDFERDQSSDCFLYVCEKLAENSFHRLLSFNTRGKASFPGWLTTVIFNLCVDWHRHEFGRVRMLPAITALSRFDQLLYHLRFERELDREACYETLRDDFPDLTRQQFSEALRRIFAVLTPRQRWQINVNMRRRQGTADIEAIQVSEALLQQCEEELPEVAAARSEQMDHLQRALSTLPNHQRLVLKLRYHQGLTYETIARVCGIDDLFKARRAVEAARAALSRALRTSAPEVRK